jgi:hypothetical protein
MDDGSESSACKDRGTEFLSLYGLLSLLSSILGTEAEDLCEVFLLTLL